jgi:hypothetical protein
MQHLDLVYRWTDCTKQNKKIRNEEETFSNEEASQLPKRAFPQFCAVFVIGKNNFF